MFKKVSVVALALMFLGGCAAMRASQARQASLQNSMSNLTLSNSPDQVLKIARMVLVERGFAPKDIGEGIIETDWKHASDRSYETGSSSSQSWKYTVTAMSMGEGETASTRLVVMQNGQSQSSGTTSSTSKPSTMRDYQLELEILRRLDPSAATNIEVEAERAAQAAAEQK